MAAAATSEYLTEASEAAIAMDQDHPALQLPNGDGSTQIPMMMRERSNSACSTGSNMNTLRVDVLRADMRLAANANGIARKGRAGVIVALELDRDTAAAASMGVGMYREYSRAELVDRLTRLIAKVGDVLSIFSNSEDLLTRIERHP